jgi:uncharacterized membrane protein YfcA
LRWLASGSLPGAAGLLAWLYIVHPDIAIPLTLLAGLGHLGMGSVDFTALVFLILGSIPGIAVGSRITGVVPDWLLRIALAIVLFYAGVLLLHR